MSRNFEVALEQVTQAVYEVWAETSEEAEEIATQLALSRTKPLLLLYSDVTCCCADEVAVERYREGRQERAA